MGGLCDSFQYFRCLLVLVRGASSGFCYRVINAIFGVFSCQVFFFQHLLFHLEFGNRHFLLGYCSFLLNFFEFGMFFNKFISMIIMHKQLRLLGRRNLHCLRDRLGKRGWLLLRKRHWWRWEHSLKLIRHWVETFLLPHHCCSLHVIGTHPLSLFLKL